jgi:hypothetical protein
MIEVRTEATVIADTPEAYQQALDRLVAVGFEVTPSAEPLTFVAIRTDHLDSL